MRLQLLMTDETASAADLIAGDGRSTCRPPFIMATMRSWDGIYYHKKCYIIYMSSRTAGTVNFYAGIESFLSQVSLLLPLMLAYCSRSWSPCRDEGVDIGTKPVYFSDLLYQYIFAFLFF
jgi:hypothetical protein